jgi:hypothetical protein
MMKSLVFMSALAAVTPDESCMESRNTTVSSSGVGKANVTVPVGADGMTTEQRNIADRLKTDNLPGSIKHLYVISATTGDCLIYSTVRGKVTSGGKRLTPTGVSEVSTSSWCHGFMTNIGGSTICTQEVLQDDGAYGSSGDYLFWYDTRGIYHQQYASACIIHVSDQPLPVKHVVLNMELKGDDQDTTGSVPVPTKKSK